jgi:hypothetical protein
LRTEGARVSELLQSQLRQPLGMNALQPQLFGGQQIFVEGVGPAQAGGYEFAPLFTSNGVAVQFDAVGGSGRTFGDQFIFSGLQDAAAFSLGQFHFQTDGLRANNDVNRNAYSAFVQVGLSPSVRLQAEVRDDRREQGDLSFAFDPSDFSSRVRHKLDLQSARLGGYFAFDPRSDLVVSAIAGRSKERQYLRDDASWFFEDAKACSPRGPVRLSRFERAGARGCLGLSQRDDDRRERLRRLEPRHTRAIGLRLRDLHRVAGGSPQLGLS